MPKLNTRRPKYVKLSGRDIGYFWLNGKRHYLPGKFGSPESVAAYHEEMSLLAKVKATGESQGVYKVSDKAGLTVADMIRVQLFSAMRPKEVRLMRPCDIDRSDDIWIYIPRQHKTQHKGKFRPIRSILILQSSP